MSGAFEYVKKMWSMMSQQGRATLLTNLASACGNTGRTWGGQTIEELSMVEDSDLLPGGLGGQLLLAATEEGWDTASVGEIKAGLSADAVKQKEEKQP